MGLLQSWLQSKFGLLPAVQQLVLFPLLLFLFLLVVRFVLMRLVSRSTALQKRKPMLKMLSLYAVIILGTGFSAFFWIAGIRRLTTRFRTNIGEEIGDPSQLLFSMLYALITTLVLLVALRLLQAGFRALTSKLSAWSSKAKEIRLQKAVLITPKRIGEILHYFLKVIFVLIALQLLYAYMSVVFSFFPDTAGLSNQLTSFVLAPAKLIVSSIIAYLPNLMTIILIIVALYYLRKFVRFILSAIGRNQIVLRGFDPEWSEPTYKLLRIVIVGFGLFICLPYLPGAGSDFFKGFSLFAGALFTLGASTAAAHMIGGVVLTYSGSFRLGDRIQVDSTTGNVVEKSLFVTRVRTPKNEIVSIPNATVLGGRLINYSGLARKEGLILHTSVGIGYDVESVQVENLLKEAAAKTPLLLKEPEPFVLEKKLGNFAVEYEINAYTNEADKMNRTYSVLKKNILELFNKAGVEIMTPAVSAVRDANQPAIPAVYKPKPFTFPGFRFLYPGAEQPETSAVTEPDIPPQGAGKKRPTA